MTCDRGISDINISAPLRALGIRKKEKTGRRYTAKRERERERIETDARQQHLRSAGLAFISLFTCIINASGDFSSFYWFFVRVIVPLSPYRCNIFGKEII